METIEKKPTRFGLIGRNIAYSFSRGYFSKKFEELNLPQYSYENFDLADISEFPKMLKQQQNIKGLNVTIPYKEAIIPYLDDLDPKALHIGAVNTIKITPEGLKGYNTDIYGFQNSLRPLLQDHHKKALVLGTGGASKAVVFVLEELGLSPQLVSRNASEGRLAYADLDKTLMDSHTVVINCTPLGTHPNVEEKPDIPYEHIGPKHLLFDLIYNPDRTAFLKEGEARGSVISNGLQMLELQAEKAWSIWNK